MPRLLTLALAALVMSSCGRADKLHRGPDESASALSVCAAGTTLAGVDVSTYQGTIDWPTTAAGGVVWAYAKATEGLAIQDDQFTNNWTGMKANGVYRGAYHFFYPEDDGTMQADFFLSTVGTIGPGDLPPMLDWEVTDGTSGATAQANAQAFVNEILAQTGKPTVIYTSPSFLAGAGVTQSFATDPLWDADWLYCTGSGCCPDMAADWTSWVFWQWSDQGTVTGISPAACVPSTSANCVDLDLFNGDLTALATFAGGSASASCPAGLADGYYCGGDQGVAGDPMTLYQCAGGAQALVETCASWCATTDWGDFCVSPHRHESRADVNGDGLADACARAADGIECWLSTGDGFQPSLIAGPALSDDAGWAAPPYDESLHFADVNGDGLADVCARGPGGFQCWLGNGSGFPTATATAGLGDDAGWSAAAYRSTIELADIDGDGKLDLCARAAADETCWLFDGAGFTTPVVAPNMSDADGWNQVQYYSTILLGDVTGDGKADLCGRGWGGFECWVSTGSAFTPPTTYVGALSDNDGGADPSVYSTIQLADVNGDGKLDVCARMTTGFACWLADGTGAFPTVISGPELSDANGWNQPQYFTTIAMADINGDGKADVCGRESDGYFCWLSTGSGFSSRIAGPTFTDDAGWGNPAYGTTLDLADVNGDGMADLCDRIEVGVSCWLSTGNGFASTPFQGPNLSDASGWDEPPYFSTLRLVGSPGGPHPSSSTSAASSSGSSASATSSSSSGAVGGTSSSGSSGVSSSGGAGTSVSSVASTPGSSGTASTSGATSSTSSTGGSTSRSMASAAAATSGGGSTRVTRAEHLGGCGCGSGPGAVPDMLFVLVGARGFRRRRAGRHRFRVRPASAGRVVR